MNQLEPYTPNQQLSPFSTPESFETAQRIAKALMSSDLVPQHFRGNLGNVLIAMELAQRSGSSILAVMQSVYIVHGTPGWSGQYCIAALNQSGRFKEPVRFEFQGSPGSDDWGCRAVTTTKAGNRVEGPLVTIGLAKSEGWYNRKGSKWQTLPELMLRYRSAAWLAKTAAPEVLMGMQTTEELYDMDEKPVTGPMEKIPQDKPDSNTVTAGDGVADLKAAIDAARVTDTEGQNANNPFDGEKSREMDKETEDEK